MAITPEVAERSLHATWISVGTALLVASVGATWRLAPRRGDVSDRWGDRAELARAGIGVKAADALRSLREDTSRLLGTVKQFDPLDVIEDPTALREAVRRVLRWFRFLDRLPIRYRQLLGIGPRLMPAVGVSAVAVVIRFGELGGLFDVSWAAAIGNTLMALSVVAMIIGLALIQQVRRTHGRNMEYVRVTEPTRRGRIHLHLVITGPNFLRKCSDTGRRTRGLPAGRRSGSPCYCTDEKPCLQKTAHGLGMGWVKVTKVDSPSRAAAYIGTYLKKGANDHRWPRYARRLSRSNGWGSLTFGQLRRQFIEHVRQIRRAAGEPADPPDGDLVWTLVPFGEPPLGVHRSTGEVLIPSRLH